MDVRCYRIGVLLSVSGPYGIPARSMADGVRIAIDQVNADPDLDVRLEPVFADPGGDNRRYHECAAAFLAGGIRHIVGCYTSSSRKEVIPLVEGRDALLWYPVHYEGFETAANVVYTGASPNHHIVPLIDYLVRAAGNKAFCVGSNYIWAWETNRIVREGLLPHGGSLVGEHYLPVGDTGEAIDAIIAAILDTQPDFISNALIGDSAYAFFRRFRAACQAAGIDQPSRFPVASSTLTEPELLAIGAEACDGHISSSVYFSSITSEANRRFVADFQAHGLPHVRISADAETTFVAVKLLAAALQNAGSDDPAAVIKALSRLRLDAPQGEVWLDPENLHAFLTPRIGRSRKDHTFEILTEAQGPEAPDPYLVRTMPRWDVLPAPVLRPVA